MNDTSSRKVRRAKSRFVMGAQQGRPDEYLFVTLTTPAGSGTDLHRAWRLFRLRLARQDLKPEYYAVREWNKMLTCEHLHVVFRVGFLPVALVRKAWCEAVNASSDEDIEFCWTKHKRMYGDVRMRCWYMAKYLSKSYGDLEGFFGVKHRSCWYSHDWIVVGWRKVSRALWWLGKHMDVYDIAWRRLGIADESILEKALTRVEEYGMIVDERALRKVECITGVRLCQSITMS